jgi:CheY-like chemotaxis protein
VRTLLNKSRKILLIDDSQFMRVAIDRILTAAGYIVKTAGDGGEGLQMAREMRPDLVLLDMMLPKTPGLAVLRALKNDPAMANIPVVVLTVLSERNRKELLAEGAAAYLEKSDQLLDEDAAALIKTVGRVLAKTIASNK